jgi:hypothetical protein
MKKLDLIKLIENEIKDYFKSNPYSLKEEMILMNEITLGELLNPNNSLPYTGKKGWYFYDDPRGTKFFVRVFYNPVREYFEFKTGWLDDNNSPQYEPSVPYGDKKSSSIDIHSRTDTVAKIYRDEVLPFFLTQNLSNILIIDPISESRGKFAERLVNKFTPKEKFDIEKESNMIIITKK